MEFRVWLILDLIFHRSALLQRRHSYDLQIRNGTPLIVLKVFRHHSWDRASARIHHRRVVTNRRKQLIGLDARHPLSPIFEPQSSR